MASPTTAEDAKKAWGERLAEIRRGLGKTQVQLAEETGLDQTTISGAEHGTGRLEVFLTIAAALDVDLLGMAS